MFTIRKRSYISFRLTVLFTSMLHILQSRAKVESIVVMLQQADGKCRLLPGGDVAVSVRLPDESSVQVCQAIRSSGAQEVCHAALWSGTAVAVEVLQLHVSVNI